MGSPQARPIRVGVVDSGWQREIKDPRIEAGRAFFTHDKPFLVGSSTDDHDVLGHGTDCARLILAVAPEVSIVPLRVFYDKLETSPAVLCAALDWAKTQRFDVLNLSLSTGREDARDYLYLLCEELRQTGTIIVSAARNGSHRGYPAVFDSVIGVTFGRAGEDLDAARRGDEPMDVVVEKGWFGPPLIPELHRPLHSTSFAAAFVTGCVARILGCEGRLSLEEVRERLAEGSVEEVLSR
jgi:subtilisin